LSQFAIAFSRFFPIGTLGGHRGKPGCGVVDSATDREGVTHLKDSWSGRAFFL
jgi:hypothetical protein